MLAGCFVGVNVILDVVVAVFSITVVSAVCSDLVVAAVFSARPNMIRKWPSSSTCVVGGAAAVLVLLHFTMPLWLARCFDCAIAVAASYRSV